MRVSDIDFVSGKVEIMSLSLRRPPVDAKYLTKAIIGLDADEIVPKFYAFGLVNREKFYDYTLPPRNVVVRAVLNPNYGNNEQNSDLRDELYRAISSARDSSLMMVFKNGAVSVAQLTGNITKFEVPHFSVVPEIQMTIKCKDPILRAITFVLMDHDDIGPVHPFEITDAISTYPHGLVFEAVLQEAHPTFVLQDKETNPNWKFELAPQGGFLAGDILRVSSEFGDKYMTLERGGVVTPQIDFFTFGSLWPMIYPGYNEFFSNYSGQIHWNSVSYRPAFWGV